MNPQDQGDQPDPRDYDFVAFWLSAGSQRELLRTAYQWHPHLPRKQWIGRAAYLPVQRPVNRDVIDHPAMAWGREVTLAVVEVVKDDYMLAVKVRPTMSIEVPNPYICVCHSLDVGEDYLSFLTRKRKGERPPFPLDLEGFLVLGGKGGRVWPKLPARASVTARLS